MVRMNNGRARRTKVTPIDIAEERHRVRESKVQLVLLAEKVGMAVPRTCCPHRGLAGRPSAPRERALSTDRLDTARTSVCATEMPSIEKRDSGFQFLPR